LLRAFAGFSSMNTGEDIIIDPNDINVDSEEPRGEWEHPDDLHEHVLNEETQELHEIHDINDAPKAKKKGKGELILKPAKSSDIAPRDPLRMYLREISRFPLLEPDEEKELARRVRDEGDNEAAFRIVSSHLRLVVKIAMDFQRRWMQNVLDLIQEGNVGLMRAVQKFDPDKGIKFSYYAAFWVKAYILKFIMDNWRLVKIGTTQTQRKLFYNLNKERQRLQRLGFDPDPATLSKNLGVSEEVVIEMDQRLARQDMSLNAPLSTDDSGSATRMDFLPALEPGVEDNVAQDEISLMIREHIKAILPKLNEKEQDILNQRLLSDNPVTLREIGEKYGITRERVRQIEARLLQKLKKHMAEHIADFSDEWIHTDE